jgi:hypothetical protein
VWEAGSPVASMDAIRIAGTVFQLSRSCMCANANCFAFICRAWRMGKEVRLG